MWGFTLLQQDLTHANSPRNPIPLRCIPLILVMNTFFISVTTELSESQKYFNSPKNKTTKYDSSVDARETQNMQNLSLLVFLVLVFIFPLPFSLSYPLPCFSVTLVL